MINIVFLGIILVSIVVLKLVKMINLKKEWPIIIIIGVLCIFGSSIIMDTLFKPTTIPIVVTAQDKKNQSAEGVEIRIVKVMVDGKSYDAADVFDGTWKKLGNGRIGWQQGEDGINRDTIVYIPSGNDIKIVFEANKWRGIADIEYNNNKQTIDFYEDTTNGENFYNFKVNYSDPYSQKNQNMLMLSIDILLFILALLVYKKMKKKYEMSNDKNELIMKYICAGIAIATFFFMLKYSGKRSLWNDDIAQIDFTHSGQSIKQMVEKLLSKDVQPPLFAVITAIWLRIAPYGTAWIRVPSEAAVGVGIYLCGITGLRVKNIRTGILCSIFVAISSTLILEGGYSFRPYAFLFLFSTLTILYYVKRYNNIGNESRRDIVLYGIAMTTLVYTHYFGILVCAALFISDIILYVKKEIKLKCIYSYILTGLLFVPWFGLALTKAMSVFQTFWPKVPDFITIKDLLNFLLSENILYKLVVLVYVIIICVKGFILWKDNKIDLKKHYIYFVFVWTIVFVIGVVFIYSAYINTSRSVFVFRYFICIIPLMFLICGISTDMICIFITENKSKTNSLIAVIIICIVFFGSIISNTYLGVINTVNSKYETFEETSDWLTNRKDIHEKDVLVVLTCYYEEGIDYYLTHNGQREAVKRLSRGQLNEEAINGINKIYLFTVHQEIDKQTKDILDKYFDRKGEYKNVSITIYERKK